MTYYVLLLAGALIGIYDTPAKCETALREQRAAMPTMMAPLRCEKREVQ